MPRLNHLAFDLDGTLLDTRQVIVDSVLACLPPRKRAAAAEAMEGDLSGSPRALLQRFGADDIELYWQAHAKHASLASFFEPRTIDVLESLKAEGKTISIVTSLPAKPAHMLLRAAGLDRQFALVDTYASRRYRKPSPQVLQLHLADLKKHPKMSAYVGDGSGDMQMARGAGVLPLGAGWSGTSAGVLLAAGAHRVFEAISDLIGFSGA